MSYYYNFTSTFLLTRLHYCRSQLREKYPTDSLVFVVDSFKEEYSFRGQFKVFAKISLFKKSIKMLTLLKTAYTKKKAISNQFNFKRHLCEIAD